MGVSITISVLGSIDTPNARANTQGKLDISWSDPNDCANAIVAVSSVFRCRRPALILVVCVRRARLGVDALYTSLC